jgi:hypothetical protein
VPLNFENAQKQSQADFGEKRPDTRATLYTPDTENKRMRNNNPNMKRNSSNLLGRTSPKLTLGGGFGGIKYNVQRSPNQVAL